MINNNFIHDVHQQYIYHHPSTGRNTCDGAQQLLSKRSVFGCFWCCLTKSTTKSAHNKKDTKNLSYTQGHLCQRTGAWLRLISRESKSLIRSARETSLQYSLVAKFPDFLVCIFHMLLFLRLLIYKWFTRFKCTNGFLWISSAN